MNEFPYTDYHDLNLDWLLDEMKKLREEWDEFQSHYPPIDAETPTNTETPNDAETPEDITEPVEVELAPAD